MNIEKANESLSAADLCFQNLLYNSSVNRAYYAMFQSAVVALQHADIRPRGEQWSHEGLQSAFAQELTRQRKIFPNELVRDLLDALIIRNVADYRERTISRRDAQQVLQKSQKFLGAVVDWINNG